MPAIVIHFSFLTLKNKIVELDKLSSDVIYEQLIGIKQEIPTGILFGKIGKEGN